MSSSTPFSAADAARVSKQVFVDSSPSDDANYDATIKVIYNLTRQASKDGYTSLYFTVPVYIPGNALCNRPLLYKQLVSRLRELDFDVFKVKDPEYTFEISWTRHTEQNSRKTFLGSERVPEFATSRLNVEEKPKKQKETKSKKSAKSKKIKIKLKK
jgi:hypothetical protein